MGALIADVLYTPFLPSSRSPAPGMSGEERAKRLLKPSAASSTSHDRLGSVGKNDSGVALRPPVTATPAFVYGLAHLHGNNASSTCCVQTKTHLLLEWSSCLSLTSLGKQVQAFMTLRVVSFPSFLEASGALARACCLQTLGMPLTVGVDRQQRQPGALLSSNSQSGLMCCSHAWTISALLSICALTHSSRRNTYGAEA